MVPVDVRPPPVFGVLVATTDSAANDRVIYWQQLGDGLETFGPYGPRIHGPDPRVC